MIRSVIWRVYFVIGLIICWGWRWLRKRGHTRKLNWIGLKMKVRGNSFILVGGTGYILEGESLRCSKQEKVWVLKGR